MMPNQKNKFNAKVGYVNTHGLIGYNDHHIEFGSLRALDAFIDLEVEDFGLRDN